VIDEKGNPVTGAQLVFGPGGLLIGQVELDGGMELTIPHDAQIDWRVRTPGFRSISGSEDYFVFSGDGARLSVQLRRGWSQTLHLRGVPMGGRVLHKAMREGLFWPLPVVGAKIFADKRLVGRTDREGRVDLDLDRLPRELAVQAPGWHGVRLVQEDETGPILWLEELPDPTAPEVDRRPRRR